MPPPAAGQNETARLLGKIRLFAELSEAELEALAYRAIRKTFSAREHLFFEGEPCRAMFLIVEGSVRVFKSSASGREITLTMETAPTSVAEIPVFDGGAYPASAAAVDRVTAYLITKQDLRALCRRHPELALKLLAVVGKRLRALVSIVHQVTFGGVRQRLARALLDFETDSGGSPFQAMETHQELALRLGTVREVVTRNLSRFQAEGLIRIRGREIRIEDRAGLEREAATELH